MTLGQMNVDTFSDEWKHSKKKVDLMSSNDSKKNNFNKKRNYNRGKKRFNRNFKGNRPNNPEKKARDTINKYLNLLDLHLASRKKYFDLFNRADPLQKAKLERNFYRTIEQLREFENNLSDNMKEQLYKNIDRYEIDNEYSVAHNINESDESITIDEITIEDPHLMQSQIQSNYSEDREESVGTIEDYQKYKGI